MKATSHSQQAKPGPDTKSKDAPKKGQGRCKKTCKCLTCCCSCSKCCGKKEKAGNRDTKQDKSKAKKSNDAKKEKRKSAGKEGCCKKCKGKCCTLLILICWIVFVITLAFGIILLFQGSCRRFPYLTPYNSYRIIFYTVVTYIFWTSLWTLIFIISSIKCKRTGRCLNCFKNLWAFVHIVIGLGLILCVCNIGLAKRFRQDVLQRIVGKAPQRQKWLIYLQQAEICCGIINSMNLPNAFLTAHCDKLFHSRKLNIGCGPIVGAYVKHCQYLLLFFVGTAAAGGLLPFVVCSKDLKKRQSRNVVVPSPRRSVAEGQTFSAHENYSHPSMKPFDDHPMSASPGSADHVESEAMGNYEKYFTFRRYSGRSSNRYSNYSSERVEV